MIKENMKKYVLIASLIIPISLFAQDYEEHSIDEIYQKIELDYGTLDENGYSIDYIFVKADIDSGTYQVELTDGPGNLYEIKGTSYYIKFDYYYGYAGYSDEGILEVGYSASSSTFYKKE